MSQKKLRANAFYSGFPYAHDTYLALSKASDGKLYYILSSERLDVGGQLYSFDPQTDATTFLADLTEICGEKGRRAIPQGKSHVEFYEADGKLFFGTHVGFYEMIQGMERLPQNPPEGYGLYPGGHFLSYDLHTGAVARLGLMPDGEGILSMAMDTDRRQICAISWPTGMFVHLDLTTGILRKIGPVSERGEAGEVGKDYRVLCRSLLVDPDTGIVYLSNAEGDILFYDPKVGGPLQVLDDVNLRLDYFGRYDPTQPGSMGYNWRKVLWSKREGVAYGIHGNSGYLFRFDPKQSKLEVIERLCSLPSKRSGMFDQFSYGYLGLQFGPDGDTLYYLTGGPVIRDGKRLEGERQIAKGGAKGLENLHLVTYQVSENRYTDHGDIHYSDGAIPTYVNSIAIDDLGRAYALARMQTSVGEIQDLIRIEPESDANGL